MKSRRTCSVENQTRSSSGTKHTRRVKKSTEHTVQRNNEGEQRRGAAQRSHGGASGNDESSPCEHEHGLRERQRKTQEKLRHFVLEQTRLAADTEIHRVDLQRFMKGLCSAQKKSTDTQRVLEQTQTELSSIISEGKINKEANKRIVRQ